MCLTGFALRAVFTRDARSLLSQQEPDSFCQGRADHLLAFFSFMRIAVDVMGGDHGCAVAIKGVKQALEADKDKSIAALYLVGNETEIDSAREQSQLRDSRVQIIHASEVLTMEDKPLEG